MKNVLIVEHMADSLSRLTESNNVSTSANKYIMGGPFTEFGIKNRNERIYTWDKFEPALVELNERISTLAVYGEFDHPDVFDTSLKNASHLVTAAYYVSEKNAVHGKIKLLSNHWGLQARALVNDNAPLFVSSRAAGVTESNGTVSLKKLFTYDIVADPGFPSARMGAINESVGYSSDTNFRIFEMNDETKINKLFEMDKNELITKQHFTQYSKYLTETMSKTNAQIQKMVKTGGYDAKKLNELSAYYESMQEEMEHMTKYFDYLAEKLQVLVVENKNLKTKTDKIIKHNDYLAEHLEKSIAYQGYIAEKLDSAIQFGEYIAEQLDKTIDYSNYIAENLDRSIDFSEYLAENLNHSINFSEYLAENLEVSIEYAQYIAENLDDTIAYQDYIAEKVDGSIGYTAMISEGLNKRNKLFENAGDELEQFPSPEDAGFGGVDNEFSTPELEEEEEIADENEHENELENELDSDLVDGEGDGVNCRVVCDDDENTDVLDDTAVETEFDADGNPIMGDETADEIGTVEETPELTDTEDCEDCEEEDNDVLTEGLSVTEQIDRLISEAKKKKTYEVNEHHFMKFMNKVQIDSFRKLTPEEQDKAASYVNEKGNYFSASDVLRLINEALATDEESLEQRLLKNIPSDLKDEWESLPEKTKASFLSQGRLYPADGLITESQVENFWKTRRFPVRINESRTLISEEDRIIRQDVLSDEAKDAIMERIMGLK